MAHWFPQLKMDDFCNAKGSEVYMAYMFILMLSIEVLLSFIGGMPNVPNFFADGANQYGQGLKVL
jgi:hypothetical protein